MDIRGCFNLELYSNLLKRLVFVNENSNENDIKEIEFLSVFYIETPPFLENPKIIEATSVEKEYVSNRLKNQYQIIWQFENVYKIIMSNSEFFIGAGKYQVNR